jgi:hypothetical protein
MEHQKAENMLNPWYTGEEPPNIPKPYRFAVVLIDVLVAWAAL